MTEHAGLAARLRELGESCARYASRLDLHGHLLHNGSDDTLEAGWCDAAALNIQALCEAVTEAAAALEARPAPAAEGEVEAAFLVTLAQRGIPTDVQELLIRGDGRGTVAPGALRAALSASRPSREAKLREALEPFAKAAALIPEGEADFKVVAYVPSRPNAAAFAKMSEGLTAQHFRAALAAISDIQKASDT